jgi:hypothetical protein
MDAQRMFYRTVLKLEVLSQDPIAYDEMELADIVEAVTTGDCSGGVERVVLNEEVDGPTMARLLQAQGSDPGFFGLTEDGTGADHSPEAE